MQTVGQRIVVLGITGSGKSTLASELATLYGFQYIELDNLFWKPNWEESDDDEFAHKVKEALGHCDQWVVDGNYTRIGSTLIWDKADTFIWLDYPLRVNFWRLWKRTWSRFLSREPMWDAGNRETLWKHFFTKDSLFVWAWQSHAKKRRQYTAMFASPNFAQCYLHHMQSPKQTNEWLASLKHEID